jgi:hypothetical protein
LPSNHHAQRLLQAAEVHKRIRLDEEEIGRFPTLIVPNSSFSTEKLSRHDGRRPERLKGRETDRHEELQFPLLVDTGFRGRDGLQGSAGGR